MTDLAAAGTTTDAAAGPPPAPLLTERRGAVLVLTLNRPERLNALNDELLGALHGALLAARDDTEVRALVVTGAGRGFSAGADLIDGSRRTIAIRDTLARRYQPLVLLLREIEKPVIAAVNGVAAGAGLSLALACDLRVCAQSATFLQAFVRIGLVPDAGATYFLPRLVGSARAAEMAMLGDVVTAVDAERFGLVSRVVPDAELMDEVMALAQRLARGPRSVGLIKRLLDMSLSSDLRSQMRSEEDLQEVAQATQDAAEGVAAFLEKRPADFRNR